MKLLDNRDVQALLREQDFHVAAAARSGNGGVEQRLREKTARESERLRVRLTRALSALNPGEALYSGVGETVRPQNEPPARSLFDRYFRLQDDRIFLERLRERGVEADRIRGRRARDKQSCRDKREPATDCISVHRWAPKVDGGAATSRTGFPGEGPSAIFAANPSASGSRADARARRARATL